MRELNLYLQSVPGWLAFTNFWLWVPVLAVTLILWIGVRIFALPDGRWRARLSLFFPAIPVGMALLSAILNWETLYNSFAIDRPMQLVWLLSLPIIVFLSFKSLSGLGSVRKTLAIMWRCGIVTLVVLALAELQFVRIADKLAVMFVIDYSLSVPEEKALPVRDYLNELMERHKPGDDLAGVIYFGKEGFIEMPLRDRFELRPPEASYDRYHTDLGAAIRLAQASFSGDTMKRIVLITDGNENRGDALRAAAAANSKGIAIDTMPLNYQYTNEVQVDKVTLPPDTTHGETVNLTILLRSTGKIGGTLRLFRIADRATGLVAQMQVELHRGVNPFTIQQRIDEPNLYKYRAVFVPDDVTQDRIARNNTIETFTWAPGAARILLIEGTEGEHRTLVSALRREAIEVEIVGPDSIPGSLVEMRPYDSIILANIPREDISEQQMEMLARNTHDLGAGLIMIGGENSFGAGGYIDSPIEEAMPVDMQIKSMKVAGKGALVLVMHACEIPQGNYWEKKICKDSIKTLSYNDEAGIVQSNGAPFWVQPLARVGNKKRIFSRIDQMVARDMISFDPTLITARNALMKSDAMTKHIILTSDGDPSDPSMGVIQSLKKAKITVTTVGVGVHGTDPAALARLRRLATGTGGRFHMVRNNNQLPKIFQKEARIVSRPLIYEKPEAWNVQIVSPTEPIAGLSGVQLPPLRGFVMTQRKKNELVEVPIVSRQPINPEPNPILAHWIYGLGKSVAFTSDTGAKWTSEWDNWEGYQKFWGQVVRWSMRSVEGGDIRVTTQLEGGKIKVTADILGENNEFVNYAELAGSVLDPDMKSHPLELKQIASGRYEGTVEDAETMGIHFISMAARMPGGKISNVVAGVTVPYPDEFRELQSNPGILDTIASVTGGSVIREEDALRFDPDTNPFRHDLAPPMAMQELWHVLLFIATIAFLFDVATRRLAVDLSSARPAFVALWGYLRGREATAAPSEYLSKLQTKKSEVSAKIEKSRATARFVAKPGTVTEDVTQEASHSGAQRQKPVAPKPDVAPDQQTEEESYTSRLLKAKKQVWDDKDKDKNKK